jgi:NADPH2:quinone reductase
MRHKRIVVHRRGGPDVLRVVEEDLPEPSPSEVRVKVQAAGVSAFDAMLRSRWFPGFPRVPFTPGVDVVGLVDKLGAEVSAIELGQTVAGMSTTAIGCYAEFVCLPASNLVAVPQGVDSADSVAVVGNYLTAHMALHRVANVQRGERILVQGAAGGVGTALLHLGKLVGLQMYGTASRHNHELVSSLDATPIDYRNEDFVERVRNLTGDGVDVVFDPVGGAKQLWRSYRSLRERGRLVWIGVAASSKAGMRVIPASLFTSFLLGLVPDGKRVPLFPNLVKDNVWYRETLADLFDSLASDRIKPVIAEQIPLVDAARAHEVIDRGGYAGKVVLIVNE